MARAMPPSDRVERLLAALTVEEKAALTAGVDLWSLPGVPRLGIPAVAMTDGPNGARGTTLPGPDATPTTCVPCGSALGATWDPELVGEVGALVAREARAKGCRVLLAPTVNIPRSPLAGRTFECYSEDPLLSGRLAAAFVRGAQAEGVVTTVKHLVANDAEFERYTMNSVIDERALREIYLVPFEHAVKDGGAFGVMSGYNRVNGTWCSESRHLVTDVLRRQWGFEGFVLTDWYAVASTLGSSAAGVDLEMPGPGRAYGEALADAVRQGTVAENTLDEQVERILSVYARLGVLDDPPDQAPPPRLPAQQRAEVARRAATDSIVLLTNDGVLPLAPDVRRMVMVGPNADRAVIMGGGSASVEPDHRTTPLDALRSKLGEAVTISYAPGVDLDRSVPVLRAPMQVEYFDALDLGGDVVHRSALETTELLHLGPPVPALGGDFSVRATGMFHPPEAGRYVFAMTQIGRARLYVDGRVVLDAFAQPQPRGTSFMGLGSAEMEQTVDLVRGGDVEVVVEYDTSGAPGLYALRVGCRQVAPPDLLERAVAAARDADVAVVVVGTTGEWESEGFDRETMSLPGDQDELVRRVASVNPNTVVVVNAGAAVTMPWIDDVRAVLQVWFGGQEMASALADVLAGDAEPGGRLPVSLPLRLEHTPAYGAFPGERNELRYGEGILVGYRWYEARHLPVLFPFGHGLSYTSFVLGEPELSSSTFVAGGALTLTVPVTNSGQRAGTEVVQCYVAPPPGDLFRPPKELKAFAKIELEPGQSGTVTLVLTDRSFACWDPGSEQTEALRARLPLGGMEGPGSGTGDGPPAGDGPGWRIGAGTYLLHVGRSCADISWTTPVTVPSEAASRPRQGG